MSCCLLIPSFATIVVFRVVPRAGFACGEGEGRCLRQRGRVYVSPDHVSCVECHRIVGGCLIAYATARPTPPHCLSHHTAVWCYQEGAASGSESGCICRRVIGLVWSATVWLVVVSLPMPLHGLRHRTAYLTTLPCGVTRRVLPPAATMGEPRTGARGYSVMLLWCHDTSAAEGSSCRATSHGSVRCSDGCVANGSRRELPYNNQPISALTSTTKKTKL